MHLKMAKLTGRKDGAWTSIDTGVSQIIAGQNITISPVDGLGAVTINGTDSGASVDVSENAPANPDEGNLWWSDNTVDDGGGRLYIYTGNEWVDVSLPGTGANFDQTEADKLYLSKKNDDSAAGLITFEKGVNVTGGTVGIGTDDPSCALEVRSALAAGERSTGIISRSSSTQSTNSNKALRVKNN